VAVIGNGVDPLYFDTPVDPADTDFREYPYVVIVGGLTKRKGGDRVLRMARTLKRELPQMRVLVAGQGEPEFSGPASAAGNVTLLQHVPTVRLVNLLRGATAAILLSRYEGFGIPVLEAMAAGTPVISSCSGALPEVVGNAGLLLDGEDASGITAAIKWLSTDNAAREQYIARGKIRAAGYRWEHCVERLVQALEYR
jgi:glycosyltransferase involved in cell wall biosynthesis